VANSTEDTRTNSRVGKCWCDEKEGRWGERGGIYTGWGRC
jgi:hypothetical protein